MDSDEDDNNSNDPLRNILNTKKLKMKIIEEKQKKENEEKQKELNKLKNLKSNINTNTNTNNDFNNNDEDDDDDIFINTGDDVKIDLKNLNSNLNLNKKQDKEILNVLKENENEDEGNLNTNKINNNKNNNNIEEIKYEEIEDEDEENSEDLFRPIFKEKNIRSTIKDEKEIEQEEKLESEVIEKARIQRKIETKKLVIKYIKEDLNKKVIFDEQENIEMPNDSDDPNDLDEYEAWKMRELKRIKLQAEEDEAKLNENLEIQRRRNLTDEQRKEENLRLGSDDTLRPFKSKLQYLQKYYHKGAFFANEKQDDMDHVFNRDYNLPTWEDKIDKSNLPKSLQKRRGLQFKKGQSKYTHLTNEDTTNFDPTFKLPENIDNKIKGYMGGLKYKEKFNHKYEGKRSKK